LPLSLAALEYPFLNSVFVSRFGRIVVSGRGLTPMTQGFSLAVKTKKNKKKKLIKLSNYKKTRLFLSHWLFLARWGLSASASA
jgi:hypothetical protein